MKFSYYDDVVRGSEREDGLLIVQFLKGMVGQTFSFLNYYKEIPVSFDARLVSVENEMAEFEVHEYQAKVISFEKKVLIRAHEKSPVPEDLVGEVFYVNTTRKKVILSRFHYAKIRSDLRRFVRVLLDGRRSDVDIYCDSDIIPASIKDISLGGVALQINGEISGFDVGKELNLVLKLKAPDDLSLSEIGATATIVKMVGDSPPYTCILEFHSERHSQQSLAYYINQRQVEIIRELKELSV
ncbi:MAG: PilZ domain-containing protein [Trichlorobacter sp.]